MPVSKATSSRRDRTVGFSLLAAAAVVLLVVFLVSISRSGSDDPPTSDVAQSTEVAESTAASTAAERDDSADLINTPDVVGLVDVEAEFQLRGLGFEVVVDPHCHFTVESQSPAAGSQVEFGSSVSLEFEPCVVPDFVGMRLPQAQAVIEDFGGLQIVWPDHCDNLVLGQDVAAGTVVDPFTTVFLDLREVC